MERPPDASGAAKGKPRRSKSDAVVKRVRTMLWNGELRPGDKIDQDRLAAELGASRIPVREALIQLEREGIVRTDFHRGSYVARFDADTVRENYELYGVLTGLASAKVAAAHDRDLVWELQRIEHAMRRPASDPRDIERLAMEFRSLILRRGGGVRLRAIIRTLMLYVPGEFLAHVPDAIGVVRRGFRDELRAIESGDAETAQAVALETARIYGEMLIETFQRRGVFEDPQPAPAARRRKVAAANGRTGTSASAAPATRRRR